ncbi:MAG: N-6 DNA methylase, partial [Chitinophagaceae bacterium]
KASHGRIKYFTYQNYLNEFDFIWDTFSKEKVLKGSFDKFVQSDKQKKGTSTVDHEFLTSLDTWRTYLANNIALRNTIDEDELNFVVQHIIDRLIFLRIAEDRSVERYGNLQDTIKSNDYYRNLLKQFHAADQKYNSGLFDFSKDKVSGKIEIDNKIIKSIISDLYYPVSPYEFSVISVEILGSAYEQFLGKTISLSKSGRAVIEEKPEVRKAGGVYYTPQYIVEYIVKNTVGKLIENKAPKDINKVKIVDPACGSGSFLIGAYQYLLQYHKDYYTNNGKPSKGSKDNPLTPDGNLTTAEKKRILLNNIFGVDLDANAVEVTKLSLLLKCMEGETEASIATQLKLFHERVLPTLDDNIKSGNSLIEVDFYDSRIDFGEDRKIKPFNWKKAFPEVFKQGGFDCVIGNPPYLRMQGIQETQPFSVNYFKSHYQAAKTGNFDLYVLFDEKGFDLLNDKGFMGFIQPHKFFQADFGEGIRNFIIKEKALTEIVTFGSQQVFEDATTYTCLLFLNKKKSNQVKVSTVEDLKAFAINSMNVKTFTTTLPKENQKWNFITEAKQSLFEKLSKQPKTLKDITRKIFVGLQTSADKIYVLEMRQETDKTAVVYSKSLDEEVEIEKGLLKPFLMGKDVKRYEPLHPRSYVIFPYQVSNGTAQLMNSDFIKNNFPLGWTYLLRNKKELEGRENNKMKGEKFYAYIYPKNLVEFEVEKICTPDIADKPRFTIDKSKSLYHTTTIYSFVFNRDLGTDEKYFLGIFNSPLLWYFLSFTGNVLRGGFFRFKTEYLKPFPIKLIDFENKTEVEQHNEIVKLVDQLLQLNEEKQNQTLQSKTDQIQNRIDYSEQRINEI